MSDKALVKFAKNLCATFHKYPISDSTREQLVKHLERNHLTDDQWSAVIDHIIDNRKDDDRGLPEPPEIISAIRSVKAKRQNENQYGSLSFTLAGRDYVIRCVHRDNLWVSVKTGTFPKIPAGATDVLMSPDNPPDPDPRDLPTVAEVREYSRIVQETIAKIGTL